MSYVVFTLHLAKIHYGVCTEITKASFTLGVSWVEWGKTLWLSHVSISLQMLPLLLQRQWLCTHELAVMLCFMAVTGIKPPGTLGRRYCPLCTTHSNEWGCNATTQEPCTTYVGEKGVKTGSEMKVIQCLLIAWLLLSEEWSKCGSRFKQQRKRKWSSKALKYRFHHFSFIRIWLLYKYYYSSDWTTFILVYNCNFEAF